MHQRTLGPDGLAVGAIGLGCMPLSLRGRPSEANAVRVIHAALDAGVTLLDTADVYCIDDGDIGHNERHIARALAEWSGDASSIVVATKGGLRRPRGEWVRDARAERLRSACEASLRALGVERIALYQLHAPDPKVPFAESVGALARLREEGKIERVGLSNVSVAELEQALAIVPVVSVQNRFSVYARQPERDGVLEACTGRGIALLAYSPLGGKRRSRMLALPVGVGRTLKRIGERVGASVYQVALAWLLAKSPVVIPIPGASTVEHAADSVGAWRVELTAEDVAEVDAAAG